MQSKQRRFIAILSFILIMITTFAYSALATSLSITGEANFRTPADIRVTDINMSEQSGASIAYEPRFTKDTITTGFTLNNASSTISYSVTITNKGEQDYAIYDLLTQSSNNSGLSILIDGNPINTALPIAVPFGTSKTITITYSSTTPGRVDVVNKFDFRKMYYVEYNLQGGSSTDDDLNNNHDIAGRSYGQIKYENVNLTLSNEEPTKQGYTFTGWNTKSDGTGTNYSKGSNYTENSNKILYAMYEKSKYTITFDADNGEENPTKEISVGDPVGTLPTVTKDGYHFEGWFTEKTNGTQITATTVPTADTTYYAQWTPYVMTINYYANGAQKNGNTQLTSQLLRTETFDYDSTTGSFGTVLPDIGLPGYVGVSTTWNLSKNGYHNSSNWHVGSANSTTKINQKTKFDNSQALATAMNKGNDFKTGNVEVNIYAGWTANTYALHFDKNNESATGVMSDQTLTYDDQETNRKINKNIFTLTGHTFVGWNTQANGQGTPYTDEQVVNIVTANNATVNLYAQWIANTYTVTYNANGGTVSTPSKQVTYGETYGALTEPEREGYTFNGWFTDNTWTTEVTASTPVTITDNQTIIAKWTANNYTVTFNPNGGNVTPTSKSVTYDSTYGNLPDASKTGYTFEEWSGKNQFDEEKYTKLQDYDIPCGAYTCSFIQLSPNTTYTLKIKRYNDFNGRNNGYLLIGILNSNGSFKTDGYWSAIAHNNSPNTMEHNYTTDETGKLYIGYYVTTQANLDTIWANTDVQIEEGSTETTYEPYQIITSSSIVKTPSNHTLYAQYSPNQLVFNNQTSSVTYNAGSANSINIVPATNGTGSYTYSKVSESNGTDSTNYFSITTNNKVTASANTPAGTYSVVVKATDNGSGVTKDATYTITVNKQKINVPTCGTFTYNKATQTFLSNTDSYTVTNNTGLNAGDYTVKATPTSNYMWSDNTTTTKDIACTINPYNIGTAGNATVSPVVDRVYDGTAYEPTPSVTVPLPSSTNTYTLTTSDLTYSYTTDHTNVGEKQVTITGKGNYTGTITKTYNITKANGFVTLNKTTENVEYSTTSTSFKVLTNSGDVSVSDDNATATVSITGDTVTVSDISTLSSGTTVVVTVTSAANTNYKEATATYTLNITNKPLVGGSVKITGNNIVGNTLTASVTDTTPAANYTYKWYREGSSTVIATTNTYTVTSSDVGKNLRVVVTATKDNYEGTSFEDTTDATNNKTEKAKTGVTKPTTAKCINPTYNGESQVLTSTAATGYAFYDNSGIAATSYTVTAKLSDNYIWSNGDTADVTFNCSIAKRNVTVKADNQSKEYDGTALTANTSCTATGQVSSHTPSCTTSGTITDYAASGAVKTLSSAKIMSGTTDVSSNYNITLQNGTLTITKKAITITAKPQTVQYGTAISKTTSDVTVATLPSTDTLSSITLSQSKAAVSTDGKITASAAVIKRGTTDTTNNYTITYNQGNLTINKKNITASISSCSNKVYDGNTNASCGITLSGVQSGETATATATCNFNNKNVGTSKEITCNTFALDGADKGNYNITTTSLTGSANITAKSITPTATASNKTYDGNTNATCTISLPGIISGDTVSSTYTGTFNNKNVGTSKAVTCSDISLTGTDKDNYSLSTTSVSTTANVTAKSVAVSWTNVGPFTYNGSNQGPTATVNTGITGETMTVNATGAINKGTHTSTATCASVTGSSACGNYTLTNTTKEFTINAQAVNPVTNLTVNTSGVVSWTASSNATGYQISIDGSTWTDMPSSQTSYNYLNVLTATSANKTVYVRAINSDADNYSTVSSGDAFAHSSNATQAVTIRTLTVSSNNTNYGTVDNTSFYAINGATYSTSSNVLTLSDGRTSTATKTDAVGYTTTFSSWSPASGTISANTTVTANFARTANSYTVTANANGGSIASTTGWTGTGNTSTKSVTYDSAYGTLPTVSRTGYTLKGWSLLPDGYKQVEYIESTGTQYIDTGYAFTTPNLTIKQKYVKNNSLSSNTFGVDLNSPRSMHGNVWNQNCYLGNSNVGASEFSESLGEEIELEFNYNNESSPLAVWMKNGSIVYTYNSSNGWTGTDKNDYIFGAQGANGSAITLSKAKIYYHQMYSEGLLVRDFVPCVQESTGKAGLYDLVEGKFYGNSADSGDDFTVPEDEYFIDSTSIVNIPDDHNIYAKWEGNTYTATFNYYNGTELTTATSQCKVTSGTSCDVTVPEEVSSSTGQYGSEYVNVSRSTSSLTPGSLALTGDTTFYAYYSSPVTIYYPIATVDSSTGALSNTSVGSYSYYRNEFYNADTTMTAVINSTQTSTSNFTFSPSASGYSLRGFANAANSTSRNHTSVANLAKTDKTTVYAFIRKGVTATVYYNSGSGDGTLTLATATTATAYRTMYCGTTTTIKMSNAKLTIPAEVSASVGQYGNKYYSVSQSTGNMTASRYSASSSTSTGANTTTLYAIYQGNDVSGTKTDVTLYYYDDDEGYKQKTMYRNSYFTSVSNSGAMSTVLSTSDTGTTNGVDNFGPGGSLWNGLSTAQDTTAEYATFAEAAAGSDLTIYAVYTMNITYDKGSHVSSIDKISDSCKITTDSISCDVTLPSITPNTGYHSVGWSTTKDATTGTAAGETYTNSSNSTKLYGNVVANELTFSDKTLSTGTYGTAYTSTAFDQASNGTGSYTYTIKSGQPTGATINSTNRTISFTNSTPAGTYNVVVTATDNNSGKTKDATMKIVINKANNAITLNCASLTYNKANQNLIASKTALGGDVYIGLESLTASNYTTKGSTALTGAQAQNAGSYTVYAYTPGNANYNATSTSKSCSIAKYNISSATVSAIADHTYDNTVYKPTPSVTVPLPSSTNTYTLTDSEYTYSYSATDPKDVATYTVTMTAKADTSTFTNNYTGSVSKTYKIVQHPGFVNLSATTGSVTYGTASKTFTVSSSHGGTLSVTDDNTTATSAISNGTVTIGSLGSLASGTKVKVTVTSAATTNYKEASATYELTITNASIDCGTVAITGNNVVGEKLTASTTSTPSDVTKTYQWYTNTSDSVTGGSPISGATSNEFTLTSSQVGKYIYATITCSKTNYTTASASGKATTTSNKTATTKTKVAKPTVADYCANPTYNGTAQTITNTAATGYAFSNNSATNYSSTGYDVTASLSTNYIWSDYTTANTTINCNITRRPVTYKADSDSKTYNGTALTKQSATLTSGTLVSGHSATFSITGTQTNAGSSTNKLNSVTIKNGTTDVTANYNITKQNGTLTVNKADATCTINSTPTLTYPGATTGNITYSCSGDGALSVTSSDTSVITVGTIGTTSTPLTAKKIGSSTISVSRAAGTNYNAATAVSSTVNVTGTIYAITLNQQSGSLGTSTIYEKYSSGYYTNSGATSQMTTSANRITIPSRSGYKFGGYYTSTGGSGTQYINADGFLTSSASSTNFTAAGNLYAKWTLDTYAISYELNGGSVSPANPTSYNVGSSDITLNNPTKTGYTFNGWTETVKSFTWTKGFIIYNTGVIEADNVDYPNSYYTELIKLESGIKYTISGYGAYNSGHIRWRVYDTDGSYIRNASEDNSWNATKDCYVRIMFYNNPTEAQRTGTVMTGKSGTTMTIPSGSTGNREYTASWTPNALTFNDQTLSTGTYGTAYTSGAFTKASNGTEDYTYTIKSGAPTGATIDSANRKISFTNSTAAGTYNVVVTATDNNSGVTKDATMSITINKAANPTTFTAVTGLKYGSTAAMVTEGSKQGTPYYAVGTELTASNYSTAGSTTIPTASSRNAGTYTIYYYIPEVSGKYNVKSGSVSVTIAKTTCPLTVSNGSMYTGATMALSTRASNNVGTLSYALKSGGNNTTTASTISNGVLTAGAMSTANDNNQTVDVQITEAASTNYNSCTKDVAITVQKNTRTLSWSSTTPAANATLTYGTSYSATASASGSGGTAGSITYASNNETGATINSTSGAITVENGNSKAVTITATMARTATVAEATTTRAFTTGKANGYVNLSANSGSVTYGTASKSFTVSSSHGGTLSVSDNNSTASCAISGTTVTCSSLGSINAGTSITVTVTSAATDNYKEASKTYTLSITRATTATTGACINPVYSGSAQNLAGNGSNVTYTNNSQTNHGSSDYTVTVTPTSNYAWSDGTYAAKTLSCNITKATPVIVHEYSQIVRDAGNTTSTTITVKSGTSTTVSGTLTASSSATGVATVAPTSTSLTAIDNSSGKATTETITSVAGGSADINFNFTPTDTTNFNSATQKTTRVIVYNKVTIAIKKDNSAWDSSEKTVKLYQSGTAKYTLTTSGSSATTTGVSAGTYDVYATKSSLDSTLVDTGVDITITTTSGITSNGSGTINYYTLTLNKGTNVTTVTGAGVYLSNQTASINATAFADGYEFDNWTKTEGNNPADANSASTTVSMSAKTTLTANAKQSGTTITYNANGGKFANNATTKAITYVESGGTQVTKYSHTSNVDDTGARQSYYGNSWTNANITGTDRGSTSKAHVVTIPGSESLTVELYYNGESVSYDWLSVWAGNYPDYNAYDHRTSTGYVTTAMGAPDNNNKFGGKNTGTYTVNGNSLTYMGHTTLTIPGDTVTFGFRSDGSSYGGDNYGYGYYAIITGTAKSYTPSTTYEEPTRDGYAFEGWYTDTSYTTEFTLDSNNIPEDLSTSRTVYAKWKQPSASELYYDNSNTGMTCETAQCAIDYLARMAKRKGIISTGNSYLCKRVTSSSSLHTETCSQSGNYCAAVEGNGNTITYGKAKELGTPLEPGDAFDCKVSTSGGYTERFYYVSDYYDTTTKSFNSDYAVLIYYSNTLNGSVSNSGAAYDSNNTNYNGPVTAVTHMPETITWKDIGLYKNERQLLTQNATTSTSGGTLPTAFSYSGKAARLLTYQEVNQACYNTTTAITSTGGLNNCNFLFENTKYSSSSLATYGPWLETPRSSDTYVYHARSNYRYVSYDYANLTTVGARPAIEVLKSDISY